MNVNNCVQILKDDDNGTEASIQITGDPEKAKEAERLIKELTEENSYSGSRFSSNNTQQSSSIADDSAVVDWGAVIKESVRLAPYLTNREDLIITYDVERSIHAPMGQRSTNCKEFLHRRPGSVIAVP